MVANAAPYTGWQTESTVTADTLALWSYNVDTMHVVMDLPMAYDSVRNSYIMGNWLTSPAQAVSQGKFGGGLSMPWSTAGGLSDVYSGNSLWPSGSDSSLSVEMWVKFNATDHILQYLIDKKYDSAGGYMMRLYHDSGNMASNVSSLDWFVGGAVVMQELEWQAGQWYHLAGTWNADNDTAYLYRNGVIVGSTTVSGMTLGGPSANTMTLAIGTRTGSSYASADALLDDVRISQVAYDYAIPEPTTLSLLTIAGLGFLRKNRK
jgi:hypothetical protein